MTVNLRIKKQPEEETEINETQEMDEERGSLATLN